MSNPYRDFWAPCQTLATVCVCVGGGLCRKLKTSTFLIIFSFTNSKVYISNFFLLISMSNLEGIWQRIIRNLQKLINFSVFFLIFSYSSSKCKGVRSTRRILTVGRSEHSLYRTRQLYCPPRNETSFGCSNRRSYVFFLDQFSGPELINF